MNIKELGQVFTPYYIVNFILDEVGYEGENLLDKKILEPSGGDGAFLKEIIDRIITYAKEKRMSDDKILDIIKKNVYGIEIDKHKYKDLINNLVSKINLKISKNITDSFFDGNIIEGDSLKQKWKDFDFIVGNPPYVRLHNLDKDYIDFLRNEFHSMKKGMVDLYYAFIEDAFKKVNDNGKISFITPNNFLVNNSGKELRKIIKNNLASVYDFQSHKIFESAMTYNCVFQINKNEDFDKKGYLPKIVRGKVEKYNKKKLEYINDKIVIKKSSNPFKILKEHKPLLEFRNGLATLSDDIYISSDFKKVNEKVCHFNNYEIECELVRDIVKISTGKKKKVIFPYEEIDGKAVVLKESKLRKSYPLTYKYFKENEYVLKRRSIDKNSPWYAFGRSQAINSIFSKKVIVKTLIKSKKDKISYDFIPKGVLVYSGLYSEYDINKKFISEFLERETLFNYLYTMGIDKSGGYKQFNSSIFRGVYYE